MIRPILPAMLDEAFLALHIYPDLDQTLYWTDRWDPALYLALARAGFISTSHVDEDLGALLVAELQAIYAVLDWKNLHVSRNVRKILRSDRIENEGIELRVVGDVTRVLDRIVTYHQPRTWLIPAYRRLLGRLPSEGAGAFSLQAVELWSTSRDELIAGELGYSIGRTYTSLSGFCAPAELAWRDFGTLQLVLLAQRLERAGYAFWNLGHVSQAYKHALGARRVPRPEFLERWADDRDRRTLSDLRAL